MDFSQGRRIVEHPPFAPPPSPSNDRGESAVFSPPAVEKEHMFDKVVTPSDVGKLNRLVIPKQHAEKYFPMDTAANMKGLLLSFEEDRTGKPWRFRYSYWNSSQSYVMTKGWSRFVKEKRLDAGDTVSFGRGVGEAARDRLFIDWKNTHLSPTLPISVHNPFLSFARSAPWSTGSGLFVPPPPPPPITLFDRRIAQRYNAADIGGQHFLFRSPTQGAVQLDNVPLVLDSVPVARNKGMGKRMRLFGVNLDCPDSDSDDCLPLQLRLGPADSSQQQGIGATKNTQT